MWKPILIGVTVLGIAGPAAQAQPRLSPPDGGVGPSTDDMGAYADARIAALRAGLRLTGEQDKLWTPLDEALRALAASRIAWMTGPSEAAPPADPIEALRRRADSLAERGAILKRVAEAAAPLYRSLDDAQKRRFLVLGRHIWPRPGIGAAVAGPGMRGPGMGGPNLNRPDMDDWDMRGPGMGGRGQGGPAMGGPDMRGPGPGIGGPDQRSPGMGGFERGGAADGRGMMRPDNRGEGRSFGGAGRRDDDFRGPL